MTTSGIITRGYGYKRDTIITRGYGRLGRIVEEAIDIVLPPRARRIRGSTTITKIAPTQPEQRQYKPYEPNVDETSEICVAVEVTGIDDDYFVDPLRGEVCRIFDEKNVRVSVSSVELRKVDDRMFVNVILSSAETIDEEVYHVSASLSRK